MPDVIIIGAGVVGSYLASRLAGIGYKVTVCEKKPQIGGPVCCTGIISRECIDTFGISDDVILRHFNAARVIYPDDRVIELRRPEVQACVVDRGALDSMMVKRAQAAGAIFNFNSPVKNIEIGNESVTVTISNGARESTVEAALVADASGFNSGITAKLTACKPGDFVMGAQATVATRGLDKVEVYFDRKIVPGFFGWLVPLSDNKALVGLMSRHNTKGYLHSLLALLTEEKKIKPESVEISVRGIPLKPLARTYGKRFIITGSAAGQVKPLTGGGIYYGLLGADLAAETLHGALVIKNFSAGYLAGYEKAWQQKLSKELRRSYRAKQVLERMTNWQLGKAFDIAVETGMVEAILAAPEVSFDWHGDLAARLVKEKALSGILKLVKSPFHVVKQVN
ncbi:MAG: NAD(P)/FAD-dependent oxidoreductase [Dehalococcoidales bacterium]|nr:NAD(P)/FAD-dependent oxidoreductase [Dehalococcoidales bacterium]